MRIPGRALLFTALVVSGSLLGAILLWRLDSRRAASPAPAADAEQAASPATPALSRSAAAPGENQREVTLFFQAPEEDALMPEKRKIFLSESVTGQAREAVRELIDGSRAGLLPTMPRDTELREIYLADDGTAYVDLSQAFVSSHPGGSAAEIDTVFSLVNTLTYNFPEIRRVKILVEGEERISLREHLDLSRVYAPDMSIVAKPREP